MNNAVFWDVTPCESCKSQRFRGKCHLHLQGGRLSFACVLSSILKMEATRSSETSIYTHEAQRTPFQTHYFSKNLVAPGIESGTSGSATRNADH
jgi:hypothetical protein